MSLALRLNQRVQLQIQSGGQDAAGQPLPSGWVNVVADGDGKLWAEVKDISGRQFAAADAAQNQVLTTITMRHRTGIVPKMRVLHGDHVFNIVAVLEQPGRILTLMCSRGVM